MKLAKAKIDNKDYYVALSLRVLKNLQDRTGNDLMQELKSLQEHFNSDKLTMLLADMLEAGYKNATRIGYDAEIPPKADELMDLIGVDDFGKIFSAIADVANDKPDLETKSKNV